MKWWQAVDHEQQPHLAIRRLFSIGLWHYFLSGLYLHTELALSNLEKVTKIEHRNKEIVVLDYANCRGDMMIDVFETAKSLNANENKAALILNVFNDKTYISPQFMRHVEQNVPLLDNLISKQAIISLTRAN